MKRVVHPLTIRICHWVNAAAFAGLMLSGFLIYNAAPFFPVTIPLWLGLGGDMKGALRWHFFLMWVLLANGALYVAYRLASNETATALLPLRTSEVKADLRLALHGRLSHSDVRYSGLQRLAYLLVLGSLVLLVASGLALWKPMQLQVLADLLGGYESARRVHFLAMAFAATFVVGHVALALSVPRTIVAMVFGRVATPVGKANT